MFNYVHVCKNYVPSDVNVCVWVWVCLCIGGWVSPTGIFTLPTCLLAAIRPCLDCGFCKYVLRFLQSLSLGRPASLRMELF